MLNEESRDYKVLLFCLRFELPATVISDINMSRIFFPALSFLSLFIFQMARVYRSVPFFSAELQQKILIIYNLHSVVYPLEKYKTHLVRFFPLCSNQMKSADEVTREDDKKHTQKLETFHSVCSKDTYTTFLTVFVSIEMRRITACVSFILFYSIRPFVTSSAFQKFVFTCCWL